MQNIGQMLLPTCGPFAVEVVRPVNPCDSAFGISEPHHPLSCANHPVIAAGRNVEGLTQLMSFGHVERDADRPDGSAIQVEQQFGTCFYPADPPVRPYDSKLPLRR